MLNYTIKVDHSNLGNCKIHLRRRNYDNIRSLPLLFDSEIILTEYEYIILTKILSKCTRAYIELSSNYKGSGIKYSKNLYIFHMAVNLLARLGQNKYKIYIYIIMTKLRKL
jgi:hypothetical protein